MEGSPVRSSLTRLFRYSRHPAYFFEVAQWWLVFLMGAAATGSLAQWTALGAGLLTLLFVGSTRFTESITLSRYPEYAGSRRGRACGRAFRASEKNSGTGAFHDVGGARKAPLNGVQVTQCAPRDSNPKPASKSPLLCR